MADKVNAKVETHFLVLLSLQLSHLSTVPRGTTTMTGWLDGLPSHSLFTLPSNAADTSTSRPFGLEASATDGGSGGRRSKLVLVRGNDLIMAVGSELRIINLPDCKAAHDDETEPRDYKVRPALSFKVISLIWDVDSVEFDSV